MKYIKSIIILSYASLALLYYYYVLIGPFKIKKQQNDIVRLSTHDKKSNLETSNLKNGQQESISPPVPRGGGGYPIVNYNSDANIPKKNKTATSPSPIQNPELEARSFDLLDAGAKFSSLKDGSLAPNSKSKPPASIQTKENGTQRNPRSTASQSKPPTGKREIPPPRPLPTREIPPPRPKSNESATLPGANSASNRKLPRGIPVVGRPGIVKSPYAPGAGYIDIRSMPPGSTTVCPFTNQAFIIPEKTTGAQQDGYPRVEEIRDKNGNTRRMIIPNKW